MQVLSYGGALGGLAVGVVLVLLICPHLSGEHAKTFVALLLLLVPAAVLAAAGRHVGAGLWRRLREGALRLCRRRGWRHRCGRWPARRPVGRGLDPGEQPVLAGLRSDRRFSDHPGRHGRHAADPDGAGAGRAVPERRGPATRRRRIHPTRRPGRVPYERSGAGSGEDSQALDRARSWPLGCGEEQEGSGFVVAHDLVVTNAHVVAGTNSITVVDAAGMAHTDVSVLLFDPEFDLAVLRVPGLPGPALSLDPNLVGRGAKAVVLGYPEGGPFAVDRAGVRSEILATGLDIYGEQPTVRAVYVVQAIVRPGNSGGPLVEPNGLVIGVVFSRSPTNFDIGYALASPGVIQRVHRAEALPPAAARRHRRVRPEMSRRRSPANRRGSAMMER